MDNSSRWITQAGGPAFGVTAVVSWRNHVLGLGPPDPRMDIDDDNRMILSSLTPRCAAGQSTPSWNKVRCATCPIGSYSHKGSAKCTSCPGGLIIRQLPTVLYVITRLPLRRKSQPGPRYVLHSTLQLGNGTAVQLRQRIFRNSVPVSIRSFTLSWERSSRQSSYWFL